MGFTFIASAKAQVIFQEKDGLLIVEMENLPSIGEWKSASTSLENRTIQYLYSETEYFQNPGNQLLTYIIRINNPGMYKFIWHSKVGEGSSPTDYNDTWLRIPDADDFFAQNFEEQVLHPKGVCEANCPNGTGADGWFKVYSHGTTDWTWTAKTSDHDPHEIFARFDEAGTYTVQVSARSSYHFLNRFVMYQPEKYTEAEVSELMLPASEWIKEEAGTVRLGLR